VLSALPSVISVPGDGGRPLPWLGATLELVSLEVNQPGSGAAAFLERLSEVMLTQALRATLLELQETEKPDLEVLHDRGSSAGSRCYVWPRSSRSAEAGLVVPVAAEAVATSRE
jgi:hypothetical protein